MATIAELLVQSDRLSAISDSARLDTELLLCHCLDKPRSYLRAWPEAEPDSHQQQRFSTLLQRRIKGEPVAHILGSRGFWTLDLAVSPATLIPRPETELLVEACLELAACRDDCRLLDLGTGTGAIALALASEKPQWKILACDNQPEAVRLAEHNHQHLQLANVEVLQSDWFGAVGTGGFDIIVSNPPYIDADDPHLQQGDLRFEPVTALVAGEQGMADIRHIVDAAQSYLLPGGYLLFEHSYQQAALVRALLLAAGYDEVRSLNDLAGHERVTLGRLGLKIEES